MHLADAAALINALCWAATGVTAKTLSSAVRPYHLITVHTLVAASAFVLIAVASGSTSAIAATPARALLLFAGAAVLNTFGSYIFFTAVARGTVGGTYTTTTGLYVLLSLLAGAVFLDERILPLAGVGAAGIVAGVYILNRPGKGRATEARQQSLGMRGRLLTGMGLGAVTAVLWTCGLLVLKWGLDDSDPLTGAFMRNIVASGIYVGVGFIIGRQKAIPRTRRRDWTVMLMSAAFFTASTYTWNYALANSDAGRTAVLSSTAPVFALVLAVLFLKEKLSKVALVCAVCAIAGMLFVVIAN